MFELFVLGQKGHTPFSRHENQIKDVVLITLWALWIGNICRGTKRWVEPGVLCMYILFES